MLLMVKMMLRMYVYFPCHSGHISLLLLIKRSKSKSKITSFQLAHITARKASYEYGIRHYLERFLLLFGIISVWASMSQSGTKLQGLTHIQTVIYLI